LPTGWWKTSLHAYDYYLRGMASFYRGTKDAISEALQLFHKAIALDPEFASAYGMAAWCYVQRKNNLWMADRAQETAAIGRLARRAARLGKDDPTALYTGGFALTAATAARADGRPRRGRCYCLCVRHRLLSRQAHRSMG
jgi:hypothetical protein